jgi:glycosyltransferase involved in cell wall biosynthesis
MFTIIIPVYNKQEYLLTTLQSVINQTFTDYEVLVIDDGSTDDSVGVVRQFADPRIKLISQKNAGVSASRNRGIQEAVGQWICFLDADDWYHPEYLAELDEMSRAHSNCAAMATRFIFLEDKPGWCPSVWTLSKRKYEFIDNLPSHWIKEVPFFTSSIAIQSKLLQSMQPCFPVGENSGEDLDLWFRLAEKIPILLLNQALVVYRTFAANSAGITKRVDVTQPYLARLLKRSIDLPPDLRRSTLNYVTHFVISTARVHASSGHRGKALKLLLQERTRGILLKRWWVSVFMVLLVPSALIANFQHWRKTRTRINPDSLDQLER